MREARATCLALEAGRTLIFDRERVTAAADAAGIAIVAASPQ
jgi:UDP-2,3-diacylglucosamine hydrolase